MTYFHFYHIHSVFANNCFIMLIVKDVIETLITYADYIQVISGKVFKNKNSFKNSIYGVNRLNNKLLRFSKSNVKYYVFMYNGTLFIVVCYKLCFSSNCDCFCFRTLTRSNCNMLKDKIHLQLIKKYK